jgi:hypothetical protein
METNSDSDSNLCGTVADFDENLSKVNLITACITLLIVNLNYVFTTMFTMSLPIKIRPKL